jgi:hypothetical protein
LAVTLLGMTAPELPGDHALAAAGDHHMAEELLATLALKHPVLAGWPVREKVMAATWLAGYRFARTHRAYGADLATWLHWLSARGINVLEVRRIHVDLWTLCRS